MLLELDSDQRLWRDTVRDVMAKECPSSFVRSIVVDNAGSADPRHYGGAMSNRVGRSSPSCRKRSSWGSSSKAGPRDRPDAFPGDPDPVRPAGGGRADPTLAAAVYDE